MTTRFQMVKINVDQFAILATSLPSEDISLSTGLSFMYSVSGKRVACHTNIEFYTSDEKILILKMCCEFCIHPEDWNNFIVDNRIIIPKPLLEFLAVHTIGTARGILFCKTEGTPFNSLILPPIDVASMIPGDMNEELMTSQ